MGQFCPYVMQGQCVNGKMCYFAHSQDEVRRLPEAMMMSMPHMMMNRTPEAMFNPMAAMMGHAPPPMLQAPPQMPNLAKLANAANSGGAADAKRKRKEAMFNP